MNLLDSGDKKKKLIILGSALIIVLLVILIVIFKDNIAELFSSKDDPSNDIEEPDSNWSGRGNQGREYGRDSDGLTDIDFIIPEETFSGVVTDYQDNSTTSDLKVETEEGLKTFRLNTSVVVFDAQTKTLKMPSELKNAKEIQVLSKPLSEDISLAAVVILNTSENLSYSSVVNASKTEDYYYLSNIFTETQFELDPNIKVTNLLTGNKYDIRQFKPGDRIFAYEGDELVQSEQISTDYEEDALMPHPEDVEDFWGISDKNIPLVDKKDLPSDFKTIKPTEVYVYPYN